MLILLALVPFLIVSGVILFQGEHYYLTSMLMMMLSIVPFIWSFERRKPSTKELVIISVMVAIAVASRLIGFMLPQVKLMASVAIIASIAMGGNVGFVIGAVSAFVSNFFFGQGEWTPFQMFGLGIVCYLMGRLFHNKRNIKTIYIALTGGVAVFLIYGGIVDFSSVLLFAEGLTLENMKPVFLSGLAFNAIYGGVTVIGIFFLYPFILKKLERINIKYGLFKS
ncbi:hypothetical protein SDC9_156812 [bioreactor metagenome]|uniref:ECF transporter S component n=1 Tax=bioreactor metagenome TaxID=1076179 RepID=A0A645F5H8_9ZZZZ